jgi:HK97 family phage prohead protease
MSSSKEFRGSATGLCVETRAEQGDVITGYAAVYNSDSVDLGFFTEVIRPGAFSRAVKDGQDVRALLDHNTGKIIGRTKAGNLTLQEDEQGLRVTLHPIDTEDGRTALAWVRSGVVDGFSFGFETVADKWGTKEGRAYRELLDVNLFEVSLVAFPAYPGTSASVRAEHLVSAEAIWREKEQKQHQEQRKMASYRRRLALLTAF